MPSLENISRPIGITPVARLDHPGISLHTTQVCNDYQDKEALTALFASAGKENVGRTGKVSTRTLSKESRQSFLLNREEKNVYQQYPQLNIAARMRKKKEQTLLMN